MAKKTKILSCFIDETGDFGDCDTHCSFYIVTGVTQKALGQLFDVDRSVVAKHLTNVFKEGELDENSVCAKSAQTADDGKTYQYKFYNPAAIIAVGYRVNSMRATQFRQWATKVLEMFLSKDNRYICNRSSCISD